MKYSHLFFRKMLPVALALGTAWAARGQIGHEYGATWAAAIGIFALVCLSGRTDWFARLPVIVALGSMAWGVGGLISYGAVVGYGYVGDYVNVSYSLLMLLFIGGLYGFLGGGIMGLAMETSAEKKVDWAALITQMFVGGFLCWGLFINELEWLMTPPRSEMWAGCLGACLALGWFLYRKGYRFAMRTGFFTALGAGFGFGAGNFFQRMGASSGIAFNWWNVMEYSIGFFAGLGMAYGVFSGGSWPKSREQDKVSNKAGWLFLILLLPILNLIEGVGTKKMTELGKLLIDSDPAAFASTWQWTSWILSLVFIIVMVWLVYRFSAPQLAGIPGKKLIITLTIIYLAWYILISNIVGATWLTGKFSSQHLYWLNLVVIYFLLRLKADGPELRTNTSGALTQAAAQTAAGFEDIKPYRGALIRWWALAIITLLLLSYIAVTFSPARAHATPRF